jgi:thiol-disulfide isomerase/thioredoxin
MRSILHAIVIITIFILSVQAIQEQSEGDAVDVVSSTDASSITESSSDVLTEDGTDERSLNSRRNDDDLKEEVVVLTSRNFSRHISLSFGRPNTIWLVEFYSPNCVHCVEFAAQYADIARYYHAHRPRPHIRVAKVNGEEERALASRFGIYAFPSFFIIDGWSVYMFEEPRSKKRLMAFAEGGYKKTTSIPFYSSPMGPLGQFQGGLMSFGHVSMDLFEWAQITFGLSPLIVGMIFFGSMFMGCFFLIVMMALIIPERPKRD